MNSVVLLELSDLNNNVSEHVEETIYLKEQYIDQEYVEDNGCNREILLFIYSFNCINLIIMVY